eukprot:9484706-Pyramimonas_sp.AAC.1
MEASWGLLGAHSGFSGGFFGQPGSVLGPKARNVRSGSPSVPHLNAVLRLFWGVLGVYWAVLGSHWAVLEPSWGPPVLFWGDLGSLLGHRGRSESPKGEC